MATVRALSIEDGNLSSSITTNRITPYSDIDLSFDVKSNGDVYKKIDAEAVKQSVKNILMCNRFNKPFKPNFGADLQSLLFDLSDPSIEEDIRTKIVANLGAYEPRAKIQNVTAKAGADNNSVAVTVIFAVLNTNKEITLTTTISRLR